MKRIRKHVWKFFRWFIDWCTVGRLLHEYILTDSPVSDWIVEKQITFDIGTASKLQSALTRLQSAPIPELEPFINESSLRSPVEVGILRCRHAISALLHLGYSVEDQVEFLNV